MDNLDEKLRTSLQKLKAYEIKKMKKMEKDQEAFFKEIRENVLGELVKKKSMDDLLSPKQITAELNISRKTFDRWVIDGLTIFQRNYGASIRVKRKELEIYLKEKYYVR